ncbi:hypothetical protein [Modicisalibacter xianhensis]|uniref:Uncharacterized protein n=1 Tax=Modicisalibacter xianhensis TaxID=442341 RepID=A0A1I2ZLW5_9GAMM|nr:hypothetical protein [Halomonas xianhensis]SFH38101.1 hypothetical protein SAMN04487959_103176 [Halomonas xianhensis]
MELRKRLEQQASRWEPDDLLQQMGYTRPRQAQRDRLVRVLADPKLGLTTAEYDFVYSSRDFLRALGRSLELAQACEALIIQRDTFEFAEREAYKPWLSVEVIDKSTRLGGFSRAMAAGKRQLPLPKDAWQMPRRAQVRLAKRLVRKHMAKTGGKLPIWGEIEGYRLYFDTDRWIFLGRNGGTRGDGSSIVSPGANSEDGPKNH